MLVTKVKNDWWIVKCDRYTFFGYRYKDVVDKAIDFCRKAGVYTAH